MTRHVFALRGACPRRRSGGRFRGPAAVLLVAAAIVLGPAGPGAPAFALGPQCGTVIADFDAYLRQSGLAVEVDEFDALERRNFMDAYAVMGERDGLDVDRLTEYRSASREGMSIVVGSFETCFVFQIVARSRLVERMKTGVLVGRTY